MDKNQELLASVRAKANEWLGDSYDSITRADVKRMLDAEDTTELIESFYKDLEFGTGGLRGIMGSGTNRMNRYTVGAATQGLANYLKEAFSELPEISVVVGHDVRNKSYSRRVRHSVHGSRVLAHGAHNDQVAKVFRRTAKIARQGKRAYRRNFFRSARGKGVRRGG